jgi:hypothetical protein
MFSDPYYLFTSLNCVHQYITIQFSDPYYLFTSLISCSSAYTIWRHSFSDSYTSCISTVLMVMDTVMLELKVGRLFGFGCMRQYCGSPKLDGGYSSARYICSLSQCLPSCHQILCMICIYTNSHFDFWSL